MDKTKVRPRELAEWIGWLNTGLSDSAPWMTSEQSRADFLCEMIDKVHRRGAIDRETAAELTRHFGLSRYD